MARKKSLKVGSESKLIDRFTVSIPREYTDILWEVGMRLKKRKSGYVFAQEFLKFNCKKLLEEIKEGKTIEDITNELEKNMENIEEKDA